MFNYISTELERAGWNVDVDEFEQETPKFGRLTFKNIVGALNPDADRYLVLACHYDSKYFKDEEFVGKQYQAVKCSMFLNLVTCGFMLKQSLNIQIILHWNGIV